MAESARERIIGAAHELFYRDGFRGVGLDAILDEVGVSKTTFYNHFESKDDLVLAVLDWHDRWWRGYFLDLLRQTAGDDPREQLLAIPNVIHEVVNSKDYHGCIFINVAVEYPIPNDPANIAARRHKEAMLDLIRQLAAYARADDPASLASAMCMVLEGAYVTGHILRDSPTVETSRRLVRMLVERHVPAPAGA